MMRTLILLFFLAASGFSAVKAQSTFYVRNSTWQDFLVETEQSGTFVMSETEWFQEDTVVRGWLETTGQEVLKFNRTNTAVPEGDTAYINIDLNGLTDSLTIKTRVIGISGGTEMDYSVEGNGFSEPWFDDGAFHEVQTTLAGKNVVIKFKPDNDDSGQNRDVRFAIHDLPVYELDQADFQNQNVLNVMFYNIQMISFNVSGMPQANDRAALLPAQISEYQDVVVFTEVFDDGPREARLIPAMIAAGFPYHTEILNPAGIIPVPTNGGVITFSRWPILEEEDIDFAECGQASQDCLANKGVKYAKIKKLDKVYHVFGTHMDAGSQSDDMFARRTQMAEIRDFIADLEIPESEAVIFGGDFNTDPVGIDMDYQAFLDTMNPIIPQHIGFYESNFNDVFGNIIDHAWGDRTHLVPTSITNEIITIRSLDPILWDLSEFSDHRCVLGRYTYPDIEMDQADTLFCPGEDVTLSISTEYPVTYQWFKDGVELNGETNSSLQLTDVLESQSGNYSCLVGYDVVYGNWTDTITPLFYPNGPETVEARLNFDFGEIVIDEITCQVGVNDLVRTDYRIYPNPTMSELNIQLGNNVKSAQIQMFSATGKLVLNQFKQGSSYNLDLSQIEVGIYVVNIRTNNESINQRVVVY